MGGAIGEGSSDVIPVWSYWEGRRPPWIELCLRTIRAHIPDVQILTKQTWGDLYTGALTQSIDAQRPNVKSDFIRAWCLANIGGIWIDADAIVFRDVRPIWEHLGASDFVSYRRAGGMLCSALIAADCESRIAADYLGYMIDRLRPADRLGPKALGPSLIGRAVRANPTAKLHCLPPRLVHQMHGRRWGRDPRLVAPAESWSPAAEAYTCMLTHKALGCMRRWSMRKILASDTVAGACYRRALR
jgi:hypothetical protein